MCWDVLLSASSKVALLIKEEPPQGALICVQVEHPMVYSASDHHVLWPTVPYLLPCVANSAKGKEVVEGAGLILQCLYVLVEEVGKGSWVGF